jgi:hypothetical protein
MVLIALMALNKLINMYIFIVFFVILNLVNPRFIFIITHHIVLTILMIYVFPQDGLTGPNINIELVIFLILFVILSTSESLIFSTHTWYH